MRYLKVHWVHNHPDEPVLMYYEVGDDEWEIRKIELFSDGRVGIASPSQEVNGSFRSEAPIPPLQEIAAVQDIYPFVITREEFDAVWAKATGSRTPDARTAPT